MPMTSPVRLTRGPEVARTPGGIRLQQRARCSGQVSGSRAHDAGGNGEVEAEGRADRENPVSGADLVGVPEPQVRVGRRPELQLEHGDIAPIVDAHDRELRSRAVGHNRLDMRQKPNDTGAGDHDPTRIDDDPGAEASLSEGAG